MLVAHCCGSNADINVRCRNPDGADSRFDTYAPVTPCPDPCRGVSRLAWSRLVEREPPARLIRHGGTIAADSIHDLVVVVHPLAATRLQPCLPDNAFNMAPG